MDTLLFLTHTVQMERGLKRLKAPQGLRFLTHTVQMEHYNENESELSNGPF